ncbi:gmc oxidoreductase protein [Rutstroemia sp. NJR-2017a BVV2]|nr:gmc oxidoreductase protein [Rutstroemia sp. NJR-2017a BVV2]
MKGVIITSPGSTWSLVNDLERPKPDKHQVLVRSLVTGINPMYVLYILTLILLHQTDMHTSRDELMHTTGLLVKDWPVVLGCDASGEIVEIGDEVTKFKVGDGVFGCTRLGYRGEKHLMDEELAFKRPGNISVGEAATVGVGLLTAAVCFAEGNHTSFPSSPANEGADAEWFIVLGGTSSVGQYGIKIVLAAGADETFDYKLSEDRQLNAIQSTTQGKFAAVFDASAANTNIGLKALGEASLASSTKTFSTTNDWDTIPTPPEGSIEIYRVHLGELGRYGEVKGDEINRAVKKYIPVLEDLLANGYLVPVEGEVAAVGFEQIRNGIEALGKGRSGKKVLHLASTHTMLTLETGTVVNEKFHAYKAKNLMVVTPCIIPISTRRDCQASCSQTVAQGYDVFTLRYFIIVTPCDALPFGGQIIGRDTALSTSYDFVVVGGGTSGLAVANRLSENRAYISSYNCIDHRSWRAVSVLNIFERHQLMMISDQGEDSIYIPLYASLYGGATRTKYDWNLTYTPNPAANNRSIPIAIGKVVGGGSCLNRMVFDRAGKVDYDRWKQLGDDNPGWDELYPYFIKLWIRSHLFDESVIITVMIQFDNFTPPTPEVVKNWGIQTDPSAHGYHGKILENFFAAMKQLGVRMVYDSLNGDANGALWNPISLDPTTKTRSNSRTAYWDSASNRSNLHLLTGQQVTKLITKSSYGGVSISGVEYAASANSSKSTVLAKKEVILAAGALHSPQLLQLSGIGDSSLLKSFGIKTVVDLPGVGANFQDHANIRTSNNISVYLSVANLTTNATYYAEQLALYRNNRTGPFSTEGTNAFAFLPTPSFTNSTSEILKSASSITPASYLPSSIDPTILAGYELQYKILLQDLLSPKMPIMEFIWSDGTILPIIQHPFSRGSVKITSTNPFVPPAANPDFLSHPTDLLLMSAAVQYGRKIVQAPAIASLSPVETLPGPAVQTEQQIQEYVRNNVGTTWHPSGSTSMMKRELGGVVDTDFRVYGVQNLRVVDAGTFPMIQSAHLQVTVYAMAERAADAIKKTYGL